MFSTRKLFTTVPCPDQKNCRRPHCPLGHTPNGKHHGLPYIPTSSSAASSTTVSSSLPPIGASSSSKSSLRPGTSNASVLSKRPDAPTPEPGSSIAHRTGDSPNKRPKAIVASTEVHCALLLFYRFHERHASVSD